MAHRWFGLQAQLRAASEGTVFAQEVGLYLDGAGWRNRVSRQLTPLHSLAYYLQPSTRQHSIANPIWQQVTRAISDHGGEPAVLQFIDFRQRLDVFVTMNYDTEYILFWKLAVSRLFLDFIH